MSENQPGAPTPSEERTDGDVYYWDKRFGHAFAAAANKESIVESMGLPGAGHADDARNGDAPPSEEPDNPPEQSFTPLPQEQVQPDEAGENTGAERSEQTEEEIMASLQDQYETLSRLITLIDTTKTPADQALAQLQENQIQQDLAQLGINIPRQRNGKDPLQELDRKLQQHIGGYLRKLFRLGRSGVDFYKQQTDADQRAHSLRSFGFLQKQIDSIAKHIGHKRNIDKMPRAFQKVQNLELLRQYRFELTYGPVETEEGEQTDQVHIAGLPNPAQFMNHVEQAVRRTRERRAVHAPEPTPGWGAGSEIVPLDHSDIEQIQAVLQTEVGEQLDHDLLQTPPRLINEKAKAEAQNIVRIDSIYRLISELVQAEKDEKTEKRRVSNTLEKLFTGYLQYAEARKKRERTELDTRVWAVSDFTPVAIDKESESYNAPYTIQVGAETIPVDDPNSDITQFLNTNTSYIDGLYASYELGEQKEPPEDDPDSLPPERQMARVYPEEYIAQVKEYMRIYREAFGEEASQKPAYKELQRRLNIALNKQNKLDGQSGDLLPEGTEELETEEEAPEEAYVEADPVIRKILTKLGFIFRIRVDNYTSQDSNENVTNHKRERILVARFKDTGDPEMKETLLKTWKEHLKEKCSLQHPFSKEIQTMITQELTVPNSYPQSQITDKIERERLKRVLNSLGFWANIVQQTEGDSLDRVTAIKVINPNSPSPLIDALKRQWMKKSLEGKSRVEQRDQRRTRGEGQNPKERIDAAHTYLHLADTYNRIFAPQASNEAGSDTDVAVPDSTEHEPSAFDQETTTQLRNLWQKTITPYNLTTEEQAQLRDSLYVLLAEPIERGEKMSLAVSENVARALEGLRFHIRREESTAGEDGTGTTPSQILIEGGKKRFAPSEDSYMKLNSFLDAQAGINQSSTAEQLNDILARAGMSRIDFADGVPFNEQQNHAKNAIDREINRIKSIGQSRVAMTDILKIMSDHARDQGIQNLQIRLS